MSAELVPLPDINAIEKVADQALYVEVACQRAKEWLANALEHGDIEGIVETKAQAEAIRIYSTQKQLGKDAELSAAEIVRRAERGLGLAVRRGQQDGTIETLSESKARAAEAMHMQRQEVSLHAEAPLKKSPADIFSNGAERTDAYSMADGVSDEQFEEAIRDGKAEANLSRANVTRKIRAKREAQEVKQKVLGGGDHQAEWIPEPGDRSANAAARRREVLRDLADKGWTSHQISDHLGITSEGLRLIARKEGVTIHADKTFGNSRQKIDSNRIIRETVASFDALDMTLSLVEFDDLDKSEIEDWTASLTASIRVLNRLNKKLKEMVQ